MPLSTPAIGEELPGEEPRERAVLDEQPEVSAEQLLERAPREEEAAAAHVQWRNLWTSLW
jgi:hypothetical protein